MEDAVSEVYSIVADSDEDADDAGPVEKPTIDDDDGTECRTGANVLLFLKEYENTYLPPLPFRVKISLASLTTTLWVATRSRARPRPRRATRFQEPLAEAVCYCHCRPRRA